jgi:pimeloyl-[acyl-carrier protein] methyl ester esterase
MLKLILLPGLDGTGELFSDFLKALPNGFAPIIVQYPPQKSLSCFELVDHVRAFCPIDEPFVIIAESFSVPIAIKYAAANPSNLKGLVLCAGFITSPIKGLSRFIGSLLAPVLFRMELPGVLAKYLLVGFDASPMLLSAVRTAISSVQKKVLVRRVRAVFVCDATLEISQIQAPILYIQAKHDRLVRCSCFKEIQRANPNVTMMTIEGPHLILQRAPLKSAEIIINIARQWICN